MNTLKSICGVAPGLGVTAVVSDGDVSMQANTNPPQLQIIDVNTIVHASLEEVWRAWTTNEGVQTFFVRKTNVKLKIDGPFELFFIPEKPKGSQGSEGCRFLSYLPQEMLSFTWNAPTQFTHARGRHTWVVLRFDELGPNIVRIKLTHLGWDQQKAANPEYVDEWQQVYEYFSNAWPYVLENLKKSFDDGPRWG